MSMVDKYKELKELGRDVEKDLNKWFWNTVLLILFWGIVLYGVFHFCNWMGWIGGNEAPTH